MALKAKRSTKTATVADELVDVLNKLGGSVASDETNFDKYMPMLESQKESSPFASSMLVRIKTGRSLSEKMVQALKDMLERFNNKPDYSKYEAMLDAVAQTDFVKGMKAKIKSGGTLSENMIASLDNLLKRHLDTLNQGEPQKPNKVEVMVRVRKWMTTDHFDRPLPIMEMEGEVLDETCKMVKVRLQGSGRPSGCCRHCGRQITHPVSLYVGLGQKCGEHYGIDFTGGGASVNYEAMKAQMEKLLWEGWLPKSQITITKIEDLEPVELPKLPKGEKKRAQRTAK